MDQRLKLVVVGDALSGKTSLLLAYTEKSFPSSYTPTVLDSWAIDVKIDGKTCDVNLFDTAGNSSHAHLRPLSYPRTHVFLVCFSLADPQSLDNARHVWIPEIRRYCGQEVPIILVGTKEDLLEKTPPEKRITREKALATAKELSCVSFLACSALTHRGLKRVFDEAFLAAVGRPVKEEPKGECCTIL